MDGSLLKGPGWAQRDGSRAQFCAVDIFRWDRGGGGDEPHTLTGIAVIIMFASPKTEQHLLITAYNVRAITKAAIPWQLFKLL